MNVLFVQRQPCIRTLKYAEGFRSTQAGVRVSFAYERSTLTEFYGHGDELFDAWIDLGPDPAPVLEEVVENLGIDLIHCHNGPDTLTNVCVDLFRGRVPVIHDVHDLMSARRTDYRDTAESSAAGAPASDGGFTPPASWLLEERRAMQETDAVIAVSDEILELAKGRGYALPQRTLTYANYVPASFVPDVLPARERTSAPRIVYEGTLTDDGGHYDLRGAFAAIADQGIEVHVYPSRNDTTYRDLAEATPGLVCHRRLPPERLLAELCQYDAGWAGFNDTLNATHLETVLPNKLFEYIASGLPVISFPHRAMARFLERTGTGIVIDRVSDLGRLLDGPTLSPARERARLTRADYTVEANIGRITGLYEDLAARSVPGVQRAFAD